MKCMHVERHEASQARIAKLEAFIKALGECVTACETQDFITNNIEEALEKP